MCSSCGSDLESSVSDNKKWIKSFKGFLETNLQMIDKKICLFINWHLLLESYLNDEYYLKNLMFLFNYYGQMSISYLKD